MSLEIGSGIDPKKLSDIASRGIMPKVRLNGRKVKGVSRFQKQWFFSFKSKYQFAFDKKNHFLSLMKSRFESAALGLDIEGHDIKLSFRKRTSGF